MFQILEFTEARLAAVTARIEKHGDDDVPAVSMGLELVAGNTLLDSIDPTIRDALYKAVEGQADLPGVPPVTPVLRCNSIDRVILPTKHDGWTLHLDDGIDDTNPMAFGGCKVDKFSVEPQQGGSVILRFRIGTNDLDAERSGFLGMHVGQPVWITLTAPKAAPPAIDGTTDAFKRDHPDLVDEAEAQGEEDADEDGPADGEASKAALDAAGNPFGAGTPEAALADAAGD